ncbi:MAG: acyl-ACP--UDP-N-acetylglucosamine O-acyltransferase [Elusimicrobia bacterium]|nr:acyl-ACP--UDP-N-acetylglucosamine O-acyltransferase [Elusimicrobiota bacterium]
MANIHPTAIVDPSAQIDASASVGPYAIIGPETVIGPGSTIGAHAVVEHVRMGKDNRLFPGCHVGVAPQDLKYAGEKTHLVMGDKNTVRECVTLNRGTAAHGETKIGSNCLFMAYSHVAHDCHLGDGVILVNSVAVAGHVTIGDYTVVGGLAAIHQYLTIGKYCMLGGGSMLNKDVPHYCLCQGYPATLRGLNTLGLRRAGFPREVLTAIKEAYKTLYHSGLRIEEAVAKLKTSHPCAQVAEMLDFIEGSKRGVMRPAAGVAEEEGAAIQ